MGVCGGLLSCFKRFATLEICDLVGCSCCVVGVCGFDVGCVVGHMYLVS